jgi:hypothetical protein
MKGRTRAGSESRSDEVDGMEDSWRSWRGSYFTHHLAFDSIESTAEPREMSHSQNGGATFSLLGWNISSAVRYKRYTFLRSSVVICPNLEPKPPAALHPSPRGVKP